MEDLLWALFRASPRRIRRSWVAEREDRQKVQVRRNLSVVHGQDRFDQPPDAGRRLHVSDVRFR